MGTAKKEEKRVDRYTYLSTVEAGLPTDSALSARIGQSRVQVIEKLNQAQAPDQSLTAEIRKILTELKQ